MCCSASVLINEVMYDPLVNDNYNEWVELYNPTNKSINLSGWTISDNYVEDFLEEDFDHGNVTMIIPAYSYAIIADHGTKIFENFTIADNITCLYVDDKSIGNGLGNTGDKLVLKNDLNETIDSMEWIVNYSDVPGYAAAYAGEGCSLSRVHNKDTNDSSQDFYDAIVPTPGYENIFVQFGKTEIQSNYSSFLIDKDETLQVNLFVKNLGDYFDNITLKILDLSFGWNVEFENKTLSLGANESIMTSIFVSPCRINGYKTGEMTLVAESKKEYNESDEITLSFEVSNPDLTIRNIKFYNDEGSQINISGEGEIIRIKAFLKNYGIDNATDVKASFYLDNIDFDHFIGCKTYDSVSRYQKYPSIKWDTKGTSAGKHKIFVVADEDNYIDEVDESNNYLSIEIEIFDTQPDLIGRNLLITEVYYHSRPGLFNEFITIFNPSNTSFNLSGWYLTNNPSRRISDQKKIVFPNNTFIDAKSKIVLTESAANYTFETGEIPFFEYNVDSDNSIPQMQSSKKFIMPNNGCMVALKDCFNHTIDLVAYGNFSSNSKSWSGKSIPSSGKGVVLKRKTNDGFFVDTNTMFDWINNRVYRLGQSDLQYEKIFFNGSIKTFVSPDCSFDVIVNEIRNANESIYLNIYEFTSPYLCDELIKALIRGVSVYIFAEGSPVGGISDEEKYVLSRIKDYGGQIRFIVSDNENDIYARYLFDHAKYLVIDNKTVIVESCNWAKTGIPENPTFGNREWGVVVKNISVAKYFLDVFFDDWDPRRCDSVSFDYLNFSFDYYIDEYTSSGFHQPSFDSVLFNGNFSVVPVFSPDFSYRAICDLIDSANKSIYVQQLYIYKNWDERINPFVEKLVSKSQDGVDVKVIMNYNPYYDDTNKKINETKNFLEKYGVETKFLYTNWSVFTNAHNKGMIIDNNSVLISSINWNENSVMNNREAGIIIHNENVSKYYADVFFYDWNLVPPAKEIQVEKIETMDYKNTIYIVVIFTLTFALIARDWRKRKWV